MPRSNLPYAAALAGFGLIAGLAGTLAMSLSQKAEMALTKREPSNTPAKAIEAVAGLPEQVERTEAVLSSAGHLAFGTTLGLALAALAKVPEPARSTAFFAGAWGFGTSLITATGAADPPSRWSAQELATDLAHHAVYAAVAAATFLGLRRLARI